MKKDDVKVGGIYTAKVTDKIVKVRIDQENTKGGWDATNLATNKRIRIKSAQRLRAKAAADDGAKQAAEAVKNGNLADGITVPTTPVKKKMSAKERRALREAAADTAPKENVSATDGTPSADAATPKVKPTRKRQGMSCLDAAAHVLTEAGEPMRTKDMVEQMMAKGLWTTNAPTPAATLYSAILREIQKKGDDARFTKADRGLFTLTGKGG